MLALWQTNAFIRFPILSLTRVHPDMLLLDLGSGIGNIVLQSDCTASDIKLMEKPAVIT